MQKFEYQEEDLKEADNIEMYQVDTDKAGRSNSSTIIAGCTGMGMEAGWRENMICGN